MKITLFLFLIFFTSAMPLIAQQDLPLAIKPGAFDLNVSNSLSEGTKKLFWATTNNLTDFVPLYLGDPKTNVNALDSKGQTALHIAIRHNNPAIVRLLLNHPHINVNIQDKNLKTPLIVAAQLELIEIVKILLERKEIDLFILDRNGNDAFEYAKNNDNYVIIELFKKAMLMTLLHHRIMFSPQQQARLIYIFGTQVYMSADTTSQPSTSSYPTATSSSCTSLPSTDFSLSSSSNSSGAS